MFNVEMASVKILHGYDIEVGVFETWISNCNNLNEAELALEENVYQDAFDSGYDVKKVRNQDFSWLVYGSTPIIYKFINMEDPKDVTYSSYRITKNYNYEEEVI